ncbi:MAG: hypothetical protein K6E73_05545 [Bacteroidales bacterium]|nr:hypothetical protein [Bacteroidales bacterium]
MMPKVVPKLVEGTSSLLQVQSEFNCPKKDTTVNILCVISEKIQEMIAENSAIEELVKAFLLEIA